MRAASPSAAGQQADKPQRAHQHRRPGEGARRRLDHERPREDALLGKLGRDVLAGKREEHKIASQQVVQRLAAKVREEAACFVKDDAGAALDKPAQPPGEQHDCRNSQRRAEDPGPVRREAPGKRARGRRADHSRQRACCRESYDAQPHFLRSARGHHARQQVGHVLHDREEAELPASDQQAELRDSYAVIGYEAAADAREGYRKRRDRAIRQQLKQAESYDEQQRIERERDQEFRPARYIRQQHDIPHGGKCQGLVFPHDAECDSRQIEHEQGAQRRLQHAGQRPPVRLVQVGQHRGIAKAEHEAGKHQLIDPIAQRLRHGKQHGLPEELQHVAVDHQHDQQATAHIYRTISHAITSKFTLRTMSVRSACILSLYAGLHRYASQEVLLRAQVQCERREHRYDTGGDHVRPLLLVLTGQQAETGGQRLVVDIGHDDARPEVVVPGAVEGEQAHDDHHRRDGRQDDPAVDLERGRAVDGRGFVQLLGDALHKVADQEDVEHACQSRPDQRVQVVDPAQRVGDAELRQDRRDVREHADVHQRPEDRVAALEGQALVGEGRQGGDDDHAHRLRNGHDERVLEHHQNVGRGVDTFAAHKHFNIVLERPGPREEARQIVERPLDGGKGRDEVRIGFEGVQKHPQHRQGPADAQQEQEDERNALHEFAFRHFRLPPLSGYFGTSRASG